MLIPDEHLYLFSDKSVAQLLGRLGFPYVSVEPALFSHYDMFLAVSCVPLSPIDSRSQAESLVQSSHGRLILAALDLFGQMRDAAVQISGLQAEANGLHSEVEALRVAFAASETDRTARLEIIHKQGDELGRIKLVRDELGKEIETLRDALASAESDRAARLEVIQQQGDQLGRVRALEADLRSEVEALRAALTSSEADRAARLAYIEQQGEDLGRLARLEGQLRAEIDELRSALAASESNHLQVVQQLGEEIGCLSAAMADGDFLKKRIRVLAAERRGPNLLTRIVDRFRPNGTNDDPDR